LVVILAGLNVLYFELDQMLFFIVQNRLVFWYVAGIYRNAFELVVNLLLKKLDIELNLSFCFYRSYLRKNNFESVPIEHNLFYLSLFEKKV
jgi:hypothetical protein